MYRALTRPTVCVVTGAVLVFGDAFGQNAVGGRLTPQEKRGKTIYVTGASPAGRLTLATLGDRSTEVPARILPCVNCHGYDGRGNAEGGVTPTNITWEFLTKPYGINLPTGRRSPPYDEVGLARAITEGVDPGGTRMTPAMPRYVMAADDLSDLVAYLKRLGKDVDPGITPESIRVGTILPSTGALAGLGADLKALLSAYFNEVNRSGGVFNRQIELHVIEAGPTAAAVRERVEHAIGQQDLFALVGAFAAGGDEELSELAEREQIPLVGPLTLLPEASRTRRFAFYLVPGAAEQARALLQFAQTTLGFTEPRIAIVSARQPPLARAADAVEQGCRRTGCRSVSRFDYSPGAFDAGAVGDALKAEASEIVFFFGATDDFVRLKQRPGAVRLALLLGALATREIFGAPVAPGDQVFLAFPTLPSDQTELGTHQFGALREQHGLATRHLPLQLYSYTAATVFVEGLRRAGRDVSREKLVAAIEELYEFRTGLIPPLTYGPDRRMGVLGAHVLAADFEKKTFAPSGEWIVLR